MISLYKSHHFDQRWFYSPAQVPSLFFSLLSSLVPSLSFLTNLQKSSRFHSFIFIWRLCRIVQCRQTTTLSRMMTLSSLGVALVAPQSARNQIQKMWKYPPPKSVKLRFVFVFIRYTFNSRLRRSTWRWISVNTYWKGQTCTLDRYLIIQHYFHLTSLVSKISEKLWIYDSEKKGLIYLFSTLLICRDGVKDNWICAWTIQG